MKINIDQFRIRKKYIKCNKHPKLDLFIWNYTAGCEYDNAWDEYTRMARGLITDREGNVIQRPFEKFFNINTRPETQIQNLPAELPYIIEKYDGSMAILYFDGNNPCIATRGSFESDQGIWATTWIQKKKFKKSDFKEGWTYILEIIYPENKIVVDYGDREDMILLAIRNIETGQYGDYIAEAKRLGLNYAKKISFMNLDHLMDYVSKMNGQEEGFVLRYRNGLFVKIKGQAYVRLHRLLTTFSNKSIWECLKNHQSLDEILKQIPDEFYKWAKEQEKSFKKQYEQISKTVEKIYNKVSKLTDRKIQAKIICKHAGELASAVFMLLDNKPIDEFIWKQIRPEYERPFINI